MKINIKLSYLFILVFFSCFGNENPTNDDTSIEPTLIAMYVNNIENSIEWYTEKLGFEIEKEIAEYPDYKMKIAFLKLGNFHLEMIEKEGAVEVSKVIKEPETYLTGFLKLGFKVKNIESLYNKLSSFKDVQIEVDVQELPTYDIELDWPSKYFLIKDPDGNLVQFFNKGASNTISPWLNMIVVNDLDKISEWYTNNLGFTNHLTLGSKETRRVSILEKNGYVLEVFEPKDRVLPSELTENTEVLGIKKIAFGVTQIDSISNKLSAEEGVEIVIPLSDVSDTNWAKRHMITKDSEGNWIQLYELKH